MTLQNKSLMPPELFDVIQTLKLDIFRTMNCVKIGRIQSYDSATATATIQILFKRVLPSGVVTSYPLLIDCPVFTLQGGGAAIQMPIAAGDQCIILFADRNIDAWFKNGDEAAPIDARSHDISDGIALVGINALTSSLTPAPSDTFVFTYAGASLNFEGGNVSLKSDGGAEIDLEAEIITIKNDTTTLLTVINGLISLIETIQVVGPISLTPASIAALEAYKTQVAVLLG